MIGFVSLIFVALAVVKAVADSMPAPFTRELKVTTPYMTGSDVLIAQNLLNRDKAVTPAILTNGVYDEATAKGCSEFQTVIGTKSTGTLDSVTAQKLLDLHTDDNFKDSGFTAASMGYLYKLHIPVHSNRSVETYGTLFDANGAVMHEFRVRTHGKRGDGTSAAWPDFGDGDVGLTQFASSGNTVTGLIEVDLNSPEPDPSLYGPYPVNRFVLGLDGNAKFLMPNIRDGLLLHTGDWSTSTQPWDTSMDMPNSSGCIHAHPEDVKKIYEILTTKLGVKVNDNTFSGKNYPYKCQGIAVVELVDNQTPHGFSRAVGRA